MMHLLVQDVDAWWRHVQAQGLIAKYGLKAEPPADRPWGMRDFVIVDPTGVLWRIGQNTSAGEQAARHVRSVLKQGSDQAKPTPPSSAIWQSGSSASSDESGRGLRPVSRT